MSRAVSLVTMFFNFKSKSLKIMENISTFTLIIADFNKDNRLIMSMKQLPLEFFKSVAFFLGHPVSSFILLYGSSFVMS